MPKKRKALLLLALCETLGDGDGLLVAEDVPVTVGERVGVALLVRVRVVVADGLEVGVLLPVLVAVRDAVALAVGEGLAVAVAEADGVRLALGDAVVVRDVVRVGVVVTVSVPDGDGVEEGVPVADLVAVGLAEGVPVADLVRVSSRHWQCRCTHRWPIQSHPFCAQTSSLAHLLSCNSFTWAAIHLKSGGRSELRLQWIAHHCLLRHIVFNK